jgi:SsrA-binding protein
MGKGLSSDNTICRNRKASFRFELLDRFECGLVLCGSEVKSLRDHTCKIEEAHARLLGGEMWLLGCHIAQYSHGHGNNHEPVRPRKLLLHAREIAKIRPKIEQLGLTLVPLRVYFNDRGLAKITIALARGKRMADKRRDHQARDHKREMDREQKRGR